MKVFFDASSLAKRYIEEERKSEDVDRLVAEAETVVVSIICFPELISAFSRLNRQKKLNTIQYEQCKRSVFRDFDAFQIWQLTPEVVKTSIALLERAELRAMDALHVACAIDAKVSLFVSSDRRQNIAAEKFHLKINPI